MDRCCTLVGEFLEFSIYSILVLRHVYAREWFSQRQLYQTVVWIPRHPMLLEYVRNQILDIVRVLREIQRMAVILFLEGNEQEIFVWEIEIPPSSRFGEEWDFAMWLRMESSFRECLLRLHFVSRNLPSPREKEGTSFRSPHLYIGDLEFFDSRLRQEESSITDIMERDVNGLLQRWISESPAASNFTRANSNTFGSSFTNPSSTSEYHTDGSESKVEYERHDNVPFPSVSSDSSSTLPSSENRSFSSPSASLASISTLPRTRNSNRKIRNSRTRTGNNRSLPFSSLFDSDSDDEAQRKGDAFDEDSNRNIDFDGLKNTSHFSEMDQPLDSLLEDLPNKKRKLDDTILTQELPTDFEILSPRSSSSSSSPSSSPVPGDESVTDHNVNTNPTAAIHSIIPEKLIPPLHILISNLNFRIQIPFDSWSAKGFIPIRSVEFPFRMRMYVRHSFDDSNKDV